MKKITLLLVCLFSGMANAGLMNTEVGCSITPTPFWVCKQASATVGAGVEFELELPQATDTFGLSVDISDTSILISNVENNAFGLGVNELLTLAFDGPILGISNFFSSGVSVISLASISFVDNFLMIDLNHGAVWGVGSYATFDLQVASSSVAEPATLVLLGLGLAGIGFTRKKKQA